MNERMLQEIIQSVRDYYDKQGIFMRKFGFGQKPALLIIDMAYGWTGPAYATGSVRLDEAVGGIQQLLPICREKGVPTIYTTSPARKDGMGPMYRRPKSTSGCRDWDDLACEIDIRLQP